MNNQISATIIADSVNNNNNRITTFEIEFHRFILPELLTHRLFSRNTSSSRAIPVLTQIKQVWSNPATPIYWGRNQAGMQANSELTGISKWFACTLWNTASKFAATLAYLTAKAKLHKQITNRILEPFVLVKMVLTATEFDNFFHLRCHKDAQPEIKELADKMYSAMQNSTPTKLRANEWHLPYVSIMDNFLSNQLEYYTNNYELQLSLEDAKLISASACAQVSYRALDMTLDKAKLIYDRLVGNQPLHCFDEKTEVYTEEGFKLFKDLHDTDKVLSVDKHTLKPIGFEIPSAIQKGFHTGTMFSVDNNSISMNITDKHNIIASTVRTASDRKNPVFTDFLADTPATEKSTKQLRILQEAILPTVLSLDINTDPEITAKGNLIGMYIGDGYKIDNTIGFHFKKQRKIDYVVHKLITLNLPYSVCKNADETTTIRVFKSDLCTTILNTCGTSTHNKAIGKWPVEMYPHIFDGLKNSDGSVKRNTWVYSTMSETLFKDFLNYSVLAGINVNANNPYKELYKLHVRTKTTVRVNDSRTPNSAINAVNVVNMPVFCCTVSGGALVVRRNGYTLISGNSSPFEHQATPMEQPTQNIYEGKVHIVDGITHIDTNANAWSGNLKGWIQLRHLIPNNTCHTYIQND